MIFGIEPKAELHGKVQASTGLWAATGLQALQGLWSLRRSLDEALGMCYKGLANNGGRLELREAYLRPM